MRKAIVCLGVSSLLVFGLGGRARADSIIEYQGPHPIDPRLSQGMCYLEGPHFHSYGPHNEILYAHVGKYWAFIGDPVEYEPRAPKYGYYGHHPMFWLEEPEPYCFITGPHYHLYAPPPELAFKLKGGVYWYVGSQPDSYEDEVNKDLDEYYATVKVAHPVVTVSPPQGFIGVVLTVPAVRIAPPVIRVRTPGVIMIQGHGWGHGWGHGRGHDRGHGDDEWDD